MLWSRLPKADELSFSKEISHKTYISQLEREIKRQKSDLQGVDLSKLEALRQQGEAIVAASIGLLPYGTCPPLPWEALPKTQALLYSGFDVKGEGREKDFQRLVSLYKVNGRWNWQFFFKNVLHVSKPTERQRSAWSRYLSRIESKLYPKVEAKRSRLEILLEKGFPVNNAESFQRLADEFKKNNKWDMKKFLRHITPTEECSRERRKWSKFLRRLETRFTTK